ncbi:SP_1767 family glycosyltransferase [Limosilactobacillus reuteri]|uniref:SP_1767 family glycosyltransferase n=1 Tax=Limosilactobacillus reuteri TaxID=1598 RepID=UPI0002EC45DB|nr:SP_1767 family glycosyltransferase [Limosilactobacillus reuteri]MCC4372563.1 SP_1767 family glycosyltransferase [Limosilactobacillus reuteri]
MKAIALSVDYRWIDQAETTLKSIYAHNKNVKTYIINHDIPHEWFVNINRYLGVQDSQLIDRKIDGERFKDMPMPEARISPMVYGKFLIPELIPEDQVLYLDSDVIVDKNLDQLFATKINDRPLYTVVDYFNPSQFNSGVLLINNLFWRNNNIGNQLLKLGHDYNLNNTQVIMNEGVAQNYGKLDPCFNFQIGYERKGYWNDKSSFYAFIDKVTDPAIIHYTEKDKPFNIEKTVELREKWWYYHNLEWSPIAADKIEINEQNGFAAEAFLFTNVAETQNLEALIEKLPNVHFNIAAYTPVNFLLSHLSQYDNVTVYPSVTARKLVELINTCDVYLDINFGEKEKYITDRVMKREIPIFAFEASKSAQLNYNNYHLFENSQIDEMVKTILSSISKQNTYPVPRLFNIHVRSVDESLNRILRERKSIIRLGDGEFTLINGQDIDYQPYNQKLAQQLKQILFNGSNKKYDVCLPDVFDGLQAYGQYAKDFYETNFFRHNQQILANVAKTANVYSNTFVSRPYIDYRDKSNSAGWFKRLKQIWQGRDLLIVEGALTRSGVGNDLFADAKSIKRILCPAKDSYQQIDKIEQAIRANAENRLILLMLGPTAKVIVDDLQDLSNQMIDIGHIDSEYEWFKMGATYKVKLDNKHTAEFNFDEDISAVHDQTYQDEIVARIIGEE